MNNARNFAILIFANVIILVAIGYFTFRKPDQNRSIASVDEVSDSLLNSVSFSWQETESGLILKISDDSGLLCEKWNSMDIVFRAEGIAYSGEVDRVVQTTVCDGGQFQQTWVPNLTKVEGPSIQKSGLFMEEPPQWVIEQVVLEGQTGSQVISSQEILQQYGSLPTLKPN